MVLWLNKKFSGPNLGPNLVQNRFLLIPWHWRFVWYCIFRLLLMIFKLLMISDANWLWLTPTALTNSTWLLSDSDQLGGSSHCVLVCIKLAFNISRKVTKPDFWKKMCLQIISLFGSKIGVFGHFLEITSLDFAKNFRNYSSYCEESSLKIQVQKKIWSQDMEISWIWACPGNFWAKSNIQ